MQCLRCELKCKRFENILFSVLSRGVMGRSGRVRMKRTEIVYLRQIYLIDL